MTIKEKEKHYDNEELNRIAVDRQWGRVFGEKTMLEIMAESTSEAEFIQEIEANF